MNDDKLYLKWVESFRKGDTNMMFEEWKLFEEVIVIADKRETE